MATAQMVRPDVITAQNSHTMVKNMIRTAVSTVCYLRNIFPNECFRERNINGLRLKVLIDGERKTGLRQSDDAQLLVNWLEKGAFDALQKKYLKRLTFALVEQDPLRAKEDEEISVLEQYSFDFSYGNEGNNVKFIASNKAMTSLDATMSTMQTLKNLIAVAENLEPVATDNHFVTMSIAFTDDCPEDYMPIHFQDASHLGGVFRLAPDAKQADLGQVTTNHHTLNLKMKTRSKTIDGSGTPEKLETSEDLLQSLRAFLVAKSSNGSNVIQTSEIRSHYRTVDSAMLRSCLLSLKKEGSISVSNNRRQFTVLLRSPHGQQTAASENTPPAGDTPAPRRLEGGEQAHMSNIADEASALESQVMAYAAMQKSVTAKALSEQFDSDHNVMKSLLQKFQAMGYVGRAGSKGRRYPTAKLRREQAKVDAATVNLNDMVEHSSGLAPDIVASSTKDSKTAARADMDCSEVDDGPAQGEAEVDTSIGTTMSAEPVKIRNRTNKRAAEDTSGKVTHGMASKVDTTSVALNTWPMSQESSEGRRYKRARVRHAMPSDTLAVPTNTLKV